MCFVRASPPPPLLRPASESCLECSAEVRIMQKRYVTEKVLIKQMATLNVPPSQELLFWLNIYSGKAVTETRICCSFILLYSRSTQYTNEDTPVSE